MGVFFWRKPTKKRSKKGEVELNEIAIKVSEFVPLPTDEKAAIKEVLENAIKIPQVAQMPRLDLYGFAETLSEDSKKLDDEINKLQTWYGILVQADNPGETGGTGGTKFEIPFKNLNAIIQQLKSLARSYKDLLPKFDTVEPNDVEKSSELKALANEVGNVRVLIPQLLTQCEKYNLDNYRETINYTSGFNENYKKNKTSVIGYEDKTNKRSGDFHDDAGILIRAEAVTFLNELNKRLETEETQIRTHFNNMAVNLQQTKKARIIKNFKAFLNELVDLNTFTPGRKNESSNQIKQKWQECAKLCSSKEDYNLMYEEFSKVNSPVLEAAVVAFFINLPSKGKAFRDSEFQELCAQRLNETEQASRFPQKKL